MNGYHVLGFGLLVFSGVISIAAFWIVLRAMWDALPVLT